MVLNDIEIIHLCECMGMIDPFEPNQVKEVDGNRVVSYGVSSFGYDARLAHEFKLFTPANCAIIDPKNFIDDIFVERTGDYLIIPPNSFALGRTIEYFKIPRDIVSICLGKSTYARCGVNINVTPLEPEWEGHVTLEIANSSPLPMKVYANEGVCQFLFFKGSYCKVSYADRAGKYQGQKGVVTAKT